MTEEPDAINVPYKPTLGEIETALRDARLLVQYVNGKRYTARRNGRTKLWVRSPNQFAIPIKWCLRECGTITERSSFAKLGEVLIVT